MLSRTPPSQHSRHPRLRHASFPPPRSPGISRLQCSILQLVRGVQVGLLENIPDLFVLLTRAAHGLRPRICCKRSFAKMENLTTVLDISYGSSLSEKHTLSLKDSGTVREHIGQHGYRGSMRDVVHNTRNFFYSVGLSLRSSSLRYTCTRSYRLRSCAGAYTTPCVTEMLRKFIHRIGKVIYYTRISWKLHSLWDTCTR